MSRSLRSQWLNIALVVGAVALIAIVVLTRSKVTTGEREARENNVLSAWRPGELSRVTFDRGKEHIVVEREGDQDAGDVSWQIREPIREEADAFAMDKLLGSLEFARWVRRIDASEVDREKFGLDQPEWVLAVQMGDIHYELRLGKEAATPTGSHYLELYAKGAPGAGVLIVSRDLAKELTLQLADLRGRLIMPYFSSSLRRIVMQGAGGTRKLAAMGDNVWRFDGMLGNVRVNREIFDQVLVQFARTKADDFLSEKVAARALGEDPVKISLVPKDEKAPAGLVEVGGQCPDNDKDVVALRRKPDVLGACVPKSVMVGLTLPAEKLVDQTLFFAQKDEVESITVVIGEKKLDLERKDNGFVMLSPMKTTVELEAGNEWLASILGAEGEIKDDADLAALGLKPPAGHIDIKYIQKSDSKLARDRVDLGKPSADGKLWVRRTHDGAVLELGREVARPIRVDTTLVRSKTVLQFTSSDFRWAEITAGNVTQRFVREESGQFRLEKPKGYEADAGLCTDVVDLLGSLSAERWVSDSDDGSFGFQHPTARVRFSTSAGDAGVKQSELVIGALVSGGAYAKLAGEPGVLVMPRRVLQALQTLLVDRSALMVAPDEAKKVTLESDGKKIELSREGDHFVQTAGPELGASSVTKVMEALAGLRAEAAVHVGAARPAEGLDQPRLLVRIEPPGSGEPRQLRFGAGDAYRNTSIVYARSSRVNATFAIAKSKVTELLDAL